MIRVVVAGAYGRVGRAMMEGLPREPDIELIGGFGRQDAEKMDSLLHQADVLVDFTTSEVAPAILHAALAAGVRPVSGTTGLLSGVLDTLDADAKTRGLGAAWAANFAVGAALMIHFARIAARYMQAAEVVEMHHDQKADAPSGTALVTARAMRGARGSDFPDPPVINESLAGARGAVDGGVRIHSVRLAGLVAHQEVLLGATGQLLTIRHDAFGRDTYLPGVALAIRMVMDHVGLVRGLDTIMGLET